MTCLLTPLSASGQNEAAIDSVQVLTDAYRSVKAENIDLRKELVDIRIENERTGAHCAEDVAMRDQQIEWLRSMLPKWYEKPVLLITATAIITIYAVLKAVQISI